MTEINIEKFKSKVDEKLNENVIPRLQQLIDNGFVEWSEGEFLIPIGGVKSIYFSQILSRDNESWNKLLNSALVY